MKHSDLLIDYCPNRVFLRQYYSIHQGWIIYYHHNENWYDREGVLVEHNIDVRFLEKVDGEWKIVYLSTVNTTSYDEDVEEGEKESETED